MPTDEAFCPDCIADVQGLVALDLNASAQLPEYDPGCTPYVVTYRVEDELGEPLFERTCHLNTLHVECHGHPQRLASYRAREAYAVTQPEGPIRWFNLDAWNYDKPDGGLSDWRDRSWIFIVTRNATSSWTVAERDSLLADVRMIVPSAALDAWYQRGATLAVPLDCADDDLGLNLKQIEALSDTYERLGGISGGTVIGTVLRRPGWTRCTYGV